MASLARNLDRAIADSQARCIVLTGAGKAFCAGADLKGGQTTYDDGPSPFVSVLTSILNSPKPVIAAINGAAFAGGLGLVAAADIAISIDTVKFSFSEVRIGVVPAIISVVCVPRIGAHNAMRLFLTGETFDAHQAQGYGLIHATAPADLHIGAVQAQVDMIRRGGPNAIMEAKKLVRRVGSGDLTEMFAWAQAKSQELFASPEATEGIAAFREKRAPTWTD